MYTKKDTSQPALWKNKIYILKNSALNCRVIDCSVFASHTICFTNIFKLPKIIGMLLTESSTKMPENYNFSPFYYQYDQIKHGD